MKKKKAYYIAYGSNMNLEQMAFRCPTARLVGTAEIKDYRLLFRGFPNSAVATIEPCKGMSVPVLVWTIEPADEIALDRYEGYPHLYRKETLSVTVNGKRRKAMVYIMNITEHRIITTPSKYYFEVIRSGYKANGIDTEPLKEALRFSIKGGR